LAIDTLTRARDPTASLTTARDAVGRRQMRIAVCERLGYLFEKEFQFLMDTRHKRKLSEKQAAWKQKINRRITNKIVVKKRTVK
jgi:hypothetical protein